MSAGTGSCCPSRFCWIPVCPPLLWEDCVVCEGVGEASEPLALGSGGGGGGRGGRGGGRGRGREDGGDGVGGGRKGGGGSAVVVSGVCLRHLNGC